MKFLTAAYLEESEAVRKELGERTQGLLMLNFQRVFEGVDTSCFREDLDKAMVMKTIIWAYEGFAAIPTPRQIRRMESAGTGLRPAARGKPTNTPDFLKQCFYRGDENE